MTSDEYRDAHGMDDAPRIDPLVARVDAIRDAALCPTCGGNGAWEITVGGGYGTFVFYGTEAEAEEMRRHKANWEHAVARKKAVPCPDAFHPATPLDDAEERAL
jgi:hypothetical protein